MSSLEAIRAARERIADAVLRTPLVRLDAPEAPCELWLKLECLQPIGSFKLRGALNAVRSAPAEAVAGGVLTASAGNMAQGVAWAAREAGVRAVVVAPENAPQTKLRAVARLGGEVIRVPHETWWQTMLDRAYPGVDALFVHPVEDEPVIAGNGTIGLELCEQLDDFDAVVCPFGGGGLSTGIATAVKALRPEVRVYAAEPETAAPLTASLAAGEPVEIEFRPSVGRRRGRPRRAAVDVAARLLGPARRRLRGARSTTPPPRCGCSPSAPAWWPRAPARSGSPPPSRAAPARAASSPSSRAGTSTPRRWPAILA